MRDLTTIDAELRLLTAVRKTCREQGVVPSMTLTDMFLDERNAVTGVHAARRNQGAGTRL
jgi:hypothetical protein